MPIITTFAISEFLTACLWKAGEKFSEKTIETVFENKRELLDKFTNLFKEEIITLELSNGTILEAVQQQIEAKPEVVEQFLKLFHYSIQV